MFCQKCGTKFEGNFCPSCGTPAVPENIDFSKQKKKVLTPNETQTHDLQVWKPTKIVPHYFEVDEINQLWLVPGEMLDNKDMPVIHRFDEISKFELLENSSSVITGGLGRAVAGGFLFGETGAIVGGVTGKRKNEQVINSMQIKITTNNMESPALYIYLIRSKTKKDDPLYTIAYNYAQEILSILSIIIKTVESSKGMSSEASQFSAADEIRKFKQLLDDDIITQEEFDIKKKELLGM